MARIYNRIGVHYNRGGAASDYTKNLIIEALRELMDRAAGRFGHRSELIELVREALFAVEGNIQARVLGRVDVPRNGHVTMIEQAHEDSISVAALQYNLDAHPLWQITTGDPYLMVLDCPEPIFSAGSKLVVRKPKLSNIFEVPARTLAIVRIEGEMKCVYILRVRDSFPYLEYLPLHTSPTMMIMNRHAYDIVGIVIDIMSSGAEADTEDGASH